MDRSEAKTALAEIKERFDILCDGGGVDWQYDNDAALSRSTYECAMKALRSMTVVEVSGSGGAA